MGKSLYDNIFKYLNLAIILLTITIITLIITGITSFWINGLGYVAGNPEKYKVSHEILEGSYSLKINLNDLESNNGKIIYNDRKNKIYIDDITWKDDGYRINFRSTGNYSLHGGTLISGIKHDYIENQGYFTIKTAQLIVLYKGNETQAKFIGVSSINYKDGDDFSFFIKPISEYSGDSITIKLVDLCKNTWNKK